MVDIAALGLKVEGVDGVDKATASLDKLTRASSGAETSSAKLGGETKKSARSLDELTKQGDKATGSVNALASAAKKAGGVIAAAFTARAMIGYADAWSDMTSLVKVNIGAQQNAADVMSRLSDIARSTYSSLELTAQGFAMNAFTLNALGKSTKQQLDYTEALNNSLVVSGAKGQQFEMVQNSLNRALAEGSLRGQELQNVLNYGSRVAELLADELGVNVTQLRELAKEGKITGDVIFRSLVGNMDLLSEQAESMPATVGDAFQLMSNAILQSVGVFDQANGLSESLAESIVGIADAIRESEDGLVSFENLIKLVGVAAAATASVMLGRSALATAATVKAFYASATAAVVKMQTEQRLTAAIAFRSAAEKSAALSALNTAKAEMQAASGTNAHRIAQDALTAAKARYAAAATSAAASQSAANAAMTVGTLAANGLRTAMAFLGGPVGVALLAATALYTLSSSAKTVATDFTSLKSPLDDVVSKMKELDAVARDAELRNMRKGVAELRDAYSDLGKSLAASAAYAKSRLSNQEKTTQAGLAAVVMLDQLKTAGESAAKGVSQDFEALYESVKNNSSITDDYRESLLRTIANLNESAKEADASAKQYDNVASAAENMASSADSAAGAIGALSNEMRNGSTAAAEYAQKQSRSLEDLKDKTAVGQLSRDIRDNADAWKTATKAEMDAAYAAAMANDAFTAQQAALRESTSGRKKLTDAEREAKKTSDDLARTQKAKLENIASEITAMERASKAWGMAASEVKLYDLRMMGATETQLTYAKSLLDTVDGFEKQKKGQEDYLKLVQDLRTDEEKLAEQLRERLKILDSINESSEQDYSRAAAGAIQDAPKFAGLAPEVGGPAGELAKIEESQAKLQDWYGTQLSMLEQFRSERSDLNEYWDEQEAALKANHDAKQDEIETARQRAKMAAGEEFFGNLAGITKSFFGENSKLYKAAFLVEKAYAINKALINAPKSYSDAYAATVGIPVVGPLLAPAAGTVAAAAQVAQASAIGGINMPSFDGGGYTGDSARAGGLDGKGGFLAMMHPKETITDHTKGQSTGGGVVVNLHEDASKAGQVQESGGDSDQRVIDIFVSNIMQEGHVYDAISGKYGMRGVGS